MSTQTSAALSLDHAANASHFALRIRTVPDDTFTVVRFASDNHGLSQDFRFDVTLLAKAELRPSTVIGNTATLEMRWGADTVYLHGLVTEFARDRTTQGGIGYRAVLASPLLPLTLSSNNRVFLNTTVPQILEEVLQDAGLSKDDYALELGESYPQREFVVQYAETDFAFLQRLLAPAGIFFTFDSDAQRTRTVFCDQSTRRPSLAGISELMYQPQSGTARTVETISALCAEARLLPGQTRLTDYNYRTPEQTLDVQAASAQTAPGEVGVYGAHFKTPEEGQQLATIRQQALDAQRLVYVGSTDCRGIVPGFLLRVGQHPDDSLNGDYLVVSVSHSADQGAALAFGDEVKGPTYRNTVQLIRADVPWRPAVPLKRQVLGMFTARVEANGTEYAYLDEQGRYRIRADFDRGTAARGEASHPVRLLQPYGGESYGIHFPLHDGTEVVLACVNGDLDRPVMVGALPNPDTPSVVTAANNSQNIIRTAGGNELLMDDRTQQERVELFTAERKNILSLDANAEGHMVRLATEEGEMTVFAKKTMTIESGDTQTVQVGNDHIVTVENAQRLLTRNKEIAFDAATDFRLKAKENILFQAEKESIEMTAGKDMVVGVGENLSVEVREKDMHLLIDSGKLSVKVAKDISVLGQGGGPITLQQRNGTLQISKNGDLSLSAGKIDINGGSIRLNGSNIGSN